jgi:hypothetical protein
MHQKERFKYRLLRDRAEPIFLLTSRAFATLALSSFSLTRSLIYTHLTLSTAGNVYISSAPEIANRLFFTSSALLTLWNLITAMTNPF